jgi:RluA family pseudouridine synthase
MTREGCHDLKHWLHPGVREIHRDDALWALDKPGGVLSHPNPPSTEVPNALIRAPYDFGRELYRLPVRGGPQEQVYLIHRLDLETSGLILCAFRAEVAATLKEALFHREVAKEYKALVLGLPRSRSGEWLDRLEKATRGGHAQVRVAKGGAPNATTSWELAEAFAAAEAALLTLRPHSGRTHQLRVQTSSRGYPIAGDVHYGDPVANRFLADELGLKRMFLHAQRLELRHPVTGHFLRLQAPFTSQLEAFLDRLRALQAPIPRRR